ncbi:biotin transporter BioY [Magnetospira thiophila]
MRAEALHPTLLSAAFPLQRQNALLRGLFLAFVGSLLLTLSAKVQVPFWPVPMTMQTFMVLLIGASFGPRLGVATIGLYLLEGALGLPVFAGTPEKGIGLAYMTGPTGGYLLGFVLSAATVGLLAQRGWDRSFLGTLATMTIGTAIILLCGVTWLSSLIGFEKALQFGLTPFLLGAAAKIALAAVVLPGAWRLLARLRS